ncbi:unnamed protein product [Spirodela intermedia]|uniref:Uncharacterized protein n=1 Tax=Spirodela intermedia TaxID=51605 RepID=A0A7I8LDW0_SPIIN|nr:unnamed protein product [Spirodela intermedia]
MAEEEGEDELRRLQESVDAEPQNASHHFEIGRLLWKKGEEENSREMKEKAVESFVISARLNPNNSAAFRYLGHYYSQVTVDEQRASKCYLRAVNLNPEDFESGECLCDLLDGAGKESLEISVCREASERSPKAFWAFRRLGYLLVHQKKWSEAVQSLQQAIRGYPTCADLWEGLGVAYQRLGMFTAAIKGVEQFRRALEISPANISGHFGLSSALLGLSKECINLGAFSWAASLLEEASDVTEASTHLAGNYSSLWKLLGDIKIAFAKCLPWIEDRKNGENDQELFETSVQRWTRARVLSVQSATHAYQRALHLSPWQANIYSDIANSIDLMDAFDEKIGAPIDIWQLPEKMSLGSLMLEGGNSEFWVSLGCLSPDNPLKQHALIRGLQLDVSRSLYRKSGNEQLSKKSFDQARSIDPTLALPWAGMSVDSPASGESLASEAYESCLRAVQLLPLPEFQIGLGKLAYLSGRLVLGAINQAVQRAPYLPESHNLKGLSCEARSDNQSAIVSYSNALYALHAFCKPAAESQIADISINLARSLCKAGRAYDAEQVCDNLKTKGNNTCEFYGKRDLSLTEAAHLAKNIPGMDPSSGAAALGLICKLVYCSLGQDHAVRTILKSPRELLQSSKTSFLVAALCALDASSPLQSLLAKGLSKLSTAEIIDMHCLTALSKMLVDESHINSRILSAQHHLKKALHMYPDSGLIRCIPSRGLRSANEVIGSANVACCGSSTGKPKLSFSTCGGLSVPLSKTIHLLQKWLHEEPWNHTAQYLLILGIMQKARVEKYPPHLCLAVRRLLSSALAREIYSTGEKQHQLYQKFQLLLCSSEICLQTGDHRGCIGRATEASRLPVSCDGLFFAHLQLCRAYAALDDLQNIRGEYLKCLQQETRHEIGWILLKHLESRHRLRSSDEDGGIDVNFAACLKGNEQSRQMWAAAFDLVCAQSFVWDEDFLLAEQTLARACAVCMELARRQAGPRFLSLAIRSLTRAQETSAAPLPVVSALLAQAVGSSAAKEKWAKNLQSEWFSWPAERRPPEVYFQMHLLPEVHDAEPSRSRGSWVLRSIHMNPYSQRYWKALRKLMEG